MAGLPRYFKNQYNGHGWSGGEIDQERMKVEKKNRLPTLMAPNESWINEGLLNSFLKNCGNRDVRNVLSQSTGKVVLARRSIAIGLVSNSARKHESIHSCSDLHSNQKPPRCVIPRL